jgi:hypothetical protein
MAESSSLASLKTIFVFPFGGEKWQSRFFVGVGLLLLGFLIPFLPSILVYGYALRVMRQVLEGDELHLPPWDDWGRLVKDGLRGLVISLIYFLPSIIIFFGGMLIYMTSAFSMPFVIENLQPSEGGGGFGPMLLALTSMAILFFSIPTGSFLFVAGAFPLPMATAHFVRKDSFAAAFRFGEWWHLLRANLPGYIISWVITAGLISLVYFGTFMLYYTIILCCLIPFLSAIIGFYSSLVCASVFGEVYRESESLLEQRSYSNETRLEAAL